MKNFVMNIFGVVHTYMDCLVERQIQFIDRSKQLNVGYRVSYTGCRNREI